MQHGKIWGYVRVSTREQSCNRQIKLLNDYADTHGLTIDHVFEETASGKNFKDRPIWQSLKLTTMRKNDLLMVTEIDRFGRNYDEIKDEYREIEKLGVFVIVLENELLSTANKSDLERRLIGDIIFSLLSYVGEKERQKLKSRQAAGIELARAAGKYKGRKKIDTPDGFETVYIKWKAGDITAIAAMKTLGIKKDAFYRIVRERKAKGQ